jgi:hypothetical protein
MTGRRRAAILAGGVLAAFVAWVWSTPAQGPPAPPNPERFEFLVVESFDARYLGDTPGHLGRASLGRKSPRVALGDPVYRQSTRVGKVSHLNWNEANESLEVEFDPDRDQRIVLGDAVWVALGKTP